MLDFLGEHITAI